jgi:YD repeat-containing protein
MRFIAISMMAWLLSSATLPAASNSARLSMQIEGLSPDGQPLLVLRWSSFSNALYRLESRRSLFSDTPWTAIDAVQTSNTNGLLRVTPEKNQTGSAQAGFYRLVLPQPELFRVEPVVWTPSGGNQVFIEGQCLGTNAQVRISNLNIKPLALQPGSLYTFSAPALPEGVYDLEWVENGQVVARLPGAIESSGLAFGTQRLAEPPLDPPAAPASHDFEAEAWHVNHFTVQPFNGELQVLVTDLQVPGRGLHFDFKRTYRSRTGQPTTMGNNWDHCYNIHIEPDGNNMVVYDGTGRRDLYLGQTNGTFSRPEFFNQGVFSNNVFVLSFADTSRWEFNPFDGSVKSGKIARMLDRNGNIMLFSYDTQGRLATIVDPLNRTNRLAYNSAGLIQSLMDFSGRTVSYNYYNLADTNGSDGDLKSVTTLPIVGTPNTNDFPIGKMTVYTYSRDAADERLNHNLRSITDPRGQTWLQVQYAPTTNPGIASFDHVSSYRRGSNSYPETFLTYLPQNPSPVNHYATLKTIVNDPVGNVTEMWFNSRNNKIVHRDLAARSIPGFPVTDTQNRPNARLRETDPDFWETRYEWNSDSLCTRITRPAGNTVQFTYESALNPNAPVRHRADLRTRSRGCCADASSSPTQVLAERFEYDPRFGSGRLKAKRSSEAYNPWDTDDLDASVSNPLYQGGHGIKNNPLYEKKERSGENPFYEKPHFVTRALDGQGNSDLYSFDSKGNLLTHQGRSLAAPDRPVESFGYNASGQLTSHVHFADANGYQRRDEFAYYPAAGEFSLFYGWLQHITIDRSGLGLTTSYDYDTHGNVQDVIDPRGYATTWIHNSLNQVVRKIAFVTPVAQGSDTTISYTTDYYYDANDNIIRIEEENRDEQGNRDPVNSTWSTFFDYDMLNLRSLVAHELVHTVQQQTVVTTRFAYDPLDNLVATYSPESLNGHQPENIVTFEYDTRNLPLRKTRAPGSNLNSTDHYDYDLNGNLRQVLAGTTSLAGTSGSQITTRFYDGFDRCIGIADPMGNVVSMAYDQNDNLIWRRVDGELEDSPGSAGNLRLSESRFEYDGHDRLSRERNSFFDPTTQAPYSDGESTLSFTYAPNGLLRSETDDNGNITRYAYDTANRLTTITDPKTNSVVFFRDATGFVTNTVRHDISELTSTEQIFSTMQFVDGLGRVTFRNNNQGNSETFGYNSRNNLVLHRDAQQTTTRYVYDGLNRLTRTLIDLDGDGKVDGAGDSLAIQTWDDNSRLSSSTDPNGNTTLFTYDALDRPIVTTTADKKVTVRGWDPHNKQSIVTDPNGTTVHFTYDLLNRCVRKDISPGSGVEATTTFETFAWDGLSRLIRASNNVSIIEMTWDSLGNQVKQKQDCIAAFATFDGVGNQLAFTHPSGLVSRFSYDGLNQIQKIGATINGTDRPNLIVNGFEGASRIGRVARANGINTRYTWNGVSGIPNNSGDLGWMRIGRVNHATAGGGPVVDQRVYKYDGVQNKTERGLASPFSAGGATSTNLYALNKLHRLTRGRKYSGTTFLRDTLYQLDKNGNRQLVQNNGTVMPYTMDATLPEPADFQMNQYTGTPFGNNQYDANGNLITVTGPALITHYTYDYADRLVSVSTEHGPALSLVAIYTYDCFGRGLSKTVNQPAPQAPVKTVYLYDGSDVCEIRADGAAVLNLIKAENHEQSLMIRGGALFYYHNDDLGSPLALTDEKGSVLERFEYDDFGKPSFLDAKGNPVGASLTGNAFLFQGMEWDPQTALYRNVPVRWSAPELNSSQNNRLLEDGWPSLYFNPDTGRHLTHVSGDPHIDQKDGTRWDFSKVPFAGNNPWTLKKEEGGRHTPFHNKFGLMLSDVGMSRLAATPRNVKCTYYIDNKSTKGMAHLHSEGVIHRDLAARNFLLDPEMPGPEGSAVVPRNILKSVLDR